MLEGLVNFRDLGGLPLADGGSVVAGRLYRSDSLAYATPEDAAHLADALGIRTVVDLREASEISSFGRGPLGERDIDYVELPIGDVASASNRSEYYVGILDKYAAEIADLIRALSSAGTLPAVIHCHVGCDRTGSVCAAILRLIGVPEDEVAIDYARSQRANAVVRSRSRARREMLGLPIMDDAYYAAWDPKPEIMATTLALLNKRWGGIDGWADHAGLTADEVTALREALLAPAA